jgi:RecA/RadA recombinase
MIPTNIPAINIALSGRLDGGLTPGLTMWAGPSKHFKTMFSLIMAKAYMEKYPDAAMLFYDSEFGTPVDYFKTLGIDMDRVVHTPITDVEQLKFDIMQQMEGFERGDHVIIIVDSIGNLASKKEVEDALEGKSVGDMTRAKQIKSLFRMVTPHLTIKDIPMVVVNHTYKTLEMFSKDVVGGGTGSYYSADNIYILGRQQEKDGTDLAGWNFIINVEKSRYVKEKSKIPITVKFEGGLSKWSGLLDMGVESKLIVKPSNGRYARVNPETGEVEDKTWRTKETDSKEFWLPVLTSKEFQDWVKETYQISAGQLIADEDLEIEDDEALQDH